MLINDLPIYYEPNHYVAVLKTAMDVDDIVEFEPGFVKKIANEIQNKIEFLWFDERESDAIELCERLEDCFGSRTEAVIRNAIDSAINYRASILKSIGRYNDASLTYRKLIDRIIKRNELTDLELYFADQDDPDILYQVSVALFHLVDLKKAKDLSWIIEFLFVIGKKISEEDVETAIDLYDNLMICLRSLNDKSLRNKIIQTQFEKANLLIKNEFTRFYNFRSK